MMTTAVQTPLWAIQARQTMQDALDRGDGPAFRDALREFRAHGGWSVLTDASDEPFPCMDAFLSAARPEGLGVPFLSAALDAYRHLRTNERPVFLAITGTRQE